MQRFSVEVTPAICNVYLWRRLKSKIGAMERARIARELHDGVIQSLIALEMHMDAAKLEKSGHRSTPLHRAASRRTGSVSGRCHGPIQPGYGHFRESHFRY